MTANIRCIADKIIAVIPFITVIRYRGIIYKAIVQACRQPSRNRNKDKFLVAIMVGDIYYPPVLVGF